MPIVWAPRSVYILSFGVAPIAPGIYPPSNAATLTAEHWVHNLEQGYIVVSSNCPASCCLPTRAEASRTPNSSPFRFLSRRRGGMSSPETGLILCPLEESCAAVSERVKSHG
jgi:hypothetical protein